jgi:hypothetical protein
MTTRPGSPLISRSARAWLLDLANSERPKAAGAGRGRGQLGSEFGSAARGEEVVRAVSAQGGRQAGGQGGRGRQAERGRQAGAAAAAHR